MKLISMHVDDFGGLHNYDFNFDEGLNVVLHDNGWGKTTMAAFLKAMLYGFDSKRSKDITENERKRYLPWQGGKYGGTLDFEAEGTHYRIIRTFGETPRFDKAKIIDADRNVTARIDPDQIGETLFRLDASAFQRSVFINQNGMSIDGAASSIHTRLNALVSKANDVSAYDDAIANLTAQVKVYEKTGARGKIGDITRRIAELEARRDRLEADIAAQDAARERISQIDSLLATINADLEKKKQQLEKVSGEFQKREASRKLLADIDRRIAGLKEKIDGIRAELGGRIPSPEEIDTIKHRKQTADALRAQVGELEAEHTKLTADYKALTERYGGTLPTSARLDDIQSAYGELQGILSTGEEVTADETVPAEYNAIRSAAENDASFISRLQIAAASQVKLQQLIGELEKQEREVRQESESWAEKRKRYAELSAESQRLRAEIDGRKRYSPALAEPVIEGLDGLQKKQNRLLRQRDELMQASTREDKGWSDKRKRYAVLQADVDALKPETENKRRYAPEKVEPVIRTLEDIQRRRQIVDVKRESLATSALTEEQKAMLEENTGILPDPAETADILKKYRNTAAHQAEIQGLSARLEGEKSKAEGLKTMLGQLGSIPAVKVAPAEKPKKPACGVLIGAGAAVAVLGVLLAVLVTPILAVLALAGAALLVSGIVMNSSYKTKLRAYESAQAAANGNRDAEQKKAELQKQLAAAAASVSALEKQIADHRSRMKEDEAAVSAWLAKWAPAGASASEELIASVSDRAEQVAKLRKKQQETAEAQSSIAEQSSAIEAERKEAEAQYPEISGMAETDALALLRAAETEYKILTDKLATAEKMLNDFLSEAGIPDGNFTEEQSAHMEELRGELQRIEKELAEAASERAAFDAGYSEIAGMSYDEALTFLRGKVSAYRVTDGQLQTALNNENKFIEQVHITREQFAQADSPRMAGLTESANKTAAELARELADANEVLHAIGITITAENAQKELRKAEQMLAVYRQYEEKLKDRTARSQKKTQQVAQLQAALDEKLAVLRGQYAELELPERLSRIRSDIAETARLKEKTAGTEAALQKQTAGLAEAQHAVEAFAAAYGAFAPEKGDILSEIFAKANIFAEQTAALQPLEKQRAAIVQESGEAELQTGADESALREQVAGLESRRDALRDEYTQKSDFIRQADHSLEEYPDIETEIRRLYDQKQKAQNTLAVLKRAVQLITKAKENLANRYLGKVEQLFNNYMHIWLNNDAVKGILDVDFNITIEENEKEHVAQGYSTGYCDLIDFCMRLALVDTLFEKEQPFLILDDPFVNLDSDRLERALELLNVMAASRQIVYFVCHPIRAVEADENSSARSAFVQLAEETRRTIEERKTSGTDRRGITKKSPKEMYKVAASGAPLPFRPAKPNYTITNNIFGLNFIMIAADAAKDNSYELFFIDAKGRVLNDRQMLELRGGKLSAERVQFCLNTREDSGDQFELMIRESGQDDYEVAARIPFRAKLAFAGTDTFDF